MRSVNVLISPPNKKTAEAVCLECELLSDDVLLLALRLELLNEPLELRQARVKALLNNTSN